jgi:hypothetical protein
MSVGLEVECSDPWCAGGQQKALTTIQTTLYDLIAALNDAAKPGEETLVVTIVAQWLRTGRIKGLRRPVESAASPLMTEMGP